MEDTIDNVVEETQEVEETNTESILKLYNELAVSMIKEKHPRAFELMDKAEDKSKIFAYIFDENRVFVFCPVKRSVYKKIKRESKDALDFTDKLVIACSLYPVISEDMIDEMPAGIIETLSDMILASSDFASDNPVVTI